MWPARRHWLEALAGVSVLCLFVTGCVTTLDDLDPPVVGTAAPLTAHRWKLWPDGIVPVCIHPRSLDDVGTAAYEEQKARIQMLAEREYEAIENSSIDFVGWGECTNLNIGSTPDVLRIILSPNSDTSAWFARRCPPGTTIAETGDCNGSANDEVIIFVKGRAYSWGNRWDSAALHELGHALGVSGHEHDRPDNDEPDCDGNGMNLQSPLTRYDADSILAATYCDKWPGTLSELDRLGFEIMYYDGPFWHSIASSGPSWSTASGSIVREDAELMIDWTARGAAPQAYGGTPTWSANGSTTQALVLPSAFVANGGPSLLTAAFTDYQGRAHGARGEIIADDGWHAAVTIAML